MNATGGHPRAGWLPGLLTAGLAAALGVAINVATDLKTDWWAWLCVVALTLASGILATAITARTTNTSSASPGGPPTLVNTRSSGGRHNTTTTTVHGGIHFNPKAVPLVITVSIIVLVAAGGGLWASGHLTRQARQQEIPFPAAGSAPNPITVAVHAVAPLCGYPWVTSKKPDQIHLPVPGEIIAYGNWSDWAEVSDGATSPPGLVQLTVQGRDDAPVTLTDIRVRVLNRRAPLRGTALTRECGDQGAIRWLEVDLDRDPVRTVAKDQFDAMPEDTPSWERKPIKFPYTVSITSPETFMIQAETKDCDCDWVADVYWSAQGKTGVLPVTNSGKPFRTTSTRNAQNCSILDTELACSN